MNKIDAFYMEIKRHREYLQLEQCFIAKLMSKHTGINFNEEEVEKILTKLSIAQYLCIDENNNDANASGYRMMAPWVYQDKW